MGKFIPYIFIEWIHLMNVPENLTENCPYSDFVDLFFESGYIAVNPGIVQSYLFIIMKTIYRKYS